MHQFFADQIEQLDLAIDQLALKDRNFDRFALMLTDNVVELVLHQNAKDTLTFARHAASEKRTDPAWKSVIAAIGRSFDAKVRYARETEMIDATMAESVLYLHGFRNMAYHQGHRPESILHSLAVFYLRIACVVLSAFKPRYFSSHSEDRISHRAVKYLGATDFLHLDASFKQACGRLVEVAAAIQEKLIDDLQSDMWSTIQDVDCGLEFYRRIPPIGPHAQERCGIARPGP